MAIKIGEANQTMKSEEVRIAILIVGGGGCGLVSSIMLSNLGIEHVLVEAHPATAHLPKASLLNQRTAEILDQHGVWNEILKIGATPEQMKYYYYMSSLAGVGPSDQFTFDRIPCYGCNNDPGFDEDFARYRRDSAYTHSNLPLIRLEPLLRAEAEKRNPGKILFNHKMISFVEMPEDVVLEVVDRATAKTTKFRAQYVISADGGKTIAPSLGVRYEGVRGLADTTSIHFKADLSAYWPDEGALITWLVGLQGKQCSLPTKGSMFGGDWSALVVNGPTWGKKSEEWVLHVAMGQIHPALSALSDDTLKSVIRSTLNIANLDIEILTTSRWHIDGIYATQYQTDRIFLAGDAAHRHPPVTGLGLNTAIGDAHNLTWKLAAALKGQANPDILRTYQEERLPVGKRVVKWALFAFMNLRVLDSSTGLLPGGKEMLEVNEDILNQLTADSFDGAARRGAFKHAIQSQRVETAAHDLELGSIYPAGLMVPDGLEAPDADPRGYLYVPLARPGHRVPHAWLKGQERLSVHQLLDDKGTWVLITDDTAIGDEWARKIARIVAYSALNLKVVRIGDTGDFQDETGQWSETSGLRSGQGGVVFVRPDAYVAFRARTFSQDDAAKLEKFVTEIIRFPVGREES